MNEQQQRTNARGCACMGAGPEISQLLSKLGPGEAALGHFRQANVEFLKGIRAMLDRSIESLSKSETKGTRVSVD